MWYVSGYINLILGWLNHIRLIKPQFSIVTPLAKLAIFLIVCWSFPIYSSIYIYIHIIIYIYVSHSMPFYAITSRQVPVRWCFFKFPSFPPKKKHPLNGTMVFCWEFPHFFGTMQLGCLIWTGDGISPWISQLRTWCLLGVRLKRSGCFRCTHQEFRRRERVGQRHNKKPTMERLETYSNL